MFHLSLSRHQALFLSVLLVLFLSLASPWWLKLQGVPPSWAVLWLLPWAVVEGPWAGALAGFGIGVLLDSLQAPGPTAVPVLVLLGLWWGQFVSARRPLERSTTLGLLALLGTLLLNGSYALQLQWRGERASAAWQLSIAQALFTALLAPMICSLLVLFWRRLSLLHGR
jgi:rod shape-determining protein MreD